MIDRIARDKLIGAISEYLNDAITAFAFDDRIGEVAAAELPELEHLELWLGTANYGGIENPDSLKPLLAGDRFPKLRYLGLRDSEIADAIAQLVADAPLLDSLQVLDLSLGTLSDAGAKALVASAKIRGLQTLDIHHHYVSPAMVRQLQQLGIDVDASEPKEPEKYNGEEYRYVALSE